MGEQEIFLELALARKHLGKHVADVTTPLKGWPHAINPTGDPHLIVCTQNYNTEIRSLKGVSYKSFKVNRTKELYLFHYILQLETFLTS